MPLSEDEIKKIQEEERVRKQARDAQDIKEKGMGCLFFLLVGLGIFFWFALRGQKTSNTQNPPSTSQQEANQYSLGTVGTLKLPEGTTLNEWYFAIDKDSYDKLTRLLLARDNKGVTNMLLTGEAFGVEKGTKLKIIDLGWTGGLEVRVESGDRVGKSGWMPVELFSRE